VAIIIGTSGWQYDDWKGRFYPADLPKKGWLPFFSARFPTVEVNNTFYNMPKAETFSTWQEVSAEGFIITIKASRYITHIRRLRECEDAVKLLWERCERLGEKLGPVLFQLPPNLRADLELLASFLRVLPREMRAAFEFRHETWDTPEVRDTLHRHGSALVLADRPGWKIRTEVTGGWSYVRFHQGTNLGPGYRRPRLRKWAEAIASLDAEETWVYFNNDPTGAAIRDAVTLAELLLDLGADVLPGAAWVDRVPARAGRGTGP